MSVVLVTSDRFSEHATPPGHPERLARAHVMQAIVEKWAAEGVRVLEPRPATRDELLRVHTAAYLDRIESMAGRPVMLDPDTFMSPSSPEIAALAAGAAIGAVDAVLTSDPGPRTPDYAIALVRPPGHHATADRAMGFCIYNNIAIAAAHALGRGLERVAIVDYDVHHGNGTQAAFYGESRVLFVSTHQYPFYPGTGAATDTGNRQGEGFTVNVPLEAGATDGDYLMVFDRLILPILGEFAPRLLLVSAGFDAHMRDPLALMRMSVGGFDGLAGRLRGFASATRCPTVFVTEGGYHLKALGACLDGLVGTLAGRERAPGAPPLAEVSGGGPDAEPLTPDAAPLVEQPTSEPTRRGHDAAHLVREVQKQYWPGL